jgi:hypothetical protein
MIVSAKRLSESDVTIPRRKAAQELPGLRQGRGALISSRTDQIINKTTKQQEKREYNEYM